ncbi:MAG: energy transducer TonB [Bacteroidota bacterium]
MRNIFILTCLLFINICSAQQNESSNNVDGPFTIVEEMPSFKGGDTEMVKFIQKNVKYPQAEKEAGITGTCFVTFIVEKNGKLGEIKILRGVSGGPGLDKEALRVVKKMPKWKPGRQNGKKVRVQYNLPIKYTIR